VILVSSATDIPDTPIAARPKRADARRNYDKVVAAARDAFTEGGAETSLEASDFAGLEPWDALAGWLRRFVAYMATKQALAAELLDYVDRDAPLFQMCRRSFHAAGDPLLARAQQSGAVRTDIDLSEVLQLVGGIAKIPGADPAQIEHLLGIALDGLRYRPPSG
jgi:hypothetical protein